MNNDSLIFLISQPRSGSTLLQKLLGAHSKIYTRSEPWLMLYPLYSLRDKGILTEYDFELGKNGLNDFLSGIKDGKNIYINELRKMYLNLYSNYISSTDYKYFLDKTPRYYLIHRELLHIFPNAKFILLIRNPLDVLGSIINTWSKDQWENLSKFKGDLYKAIDEYIYIIDNKRKNILLVHYENLLENSDRVIKEIFNFLELRHEDVTNDYYKNNEKWIFGDQCNVYLKKGIDKKNSGNWKNDLSEPQYWRVMCDYLNYIGKERFEKLGYNFEESKLILEKKLPLSSLDYIISKTESLSELLDSDMNTYNVKKIKKELFEKKQEIEHIKKEFSSAEVALISGKNELQKIYSSYEWKSVLILHKIIKIIIPESSWRRKVFIELWKLAGSFLQLYLRAYREIRSAIFIIHNYLIRYKPRKKRKINLKSRKIVYVGHSHHNKTKSTGFLIDYLKEIYDVEVVSDESWLGKSFPDLSFVDKSYLGVIFFQLLPPKEIIEKIKNDNIIFFPMYDQSGRLEIDFWSKYRDLKIANFSKNLHKKLSKWGFESMYVQFFPKPQEFYPGKKDEVFFWQRLTKININTIAKFLKKENVKIHLHRAIDPWQKFIQPSKEDEKKFQITYSDWFETREEMHEVIKQKGIYVAPREYEGIGLSFLEAMAMGKAVIALDNPTMNEYIENGKTGYLFNLKKLGKIDLSSIEQVQKNAYKYMREGYKKWEKEKIKIIEFIKK